MADDQNIENTQFDASTVMTFEELKQLLSQLVDTGVSDLHLHSWWPPYQRDPNGELCNIEEEPARVVPESELFKLAYWVCRGTPHLVRLHAIERQYAQLQEWYRDGDEEKAQIGVPADFEHWIVPNSFDVGIDVKSDEGNVGRFRVQIFFSDSDNLYEAGINLAFRRIVPELPTYIELGFSPAAGHLVSDVISQKVANGLILVIGATGSGKSTTVGAIVEAINEKLAVNITTIEDPIEYKFTNKCAYIRQIGVHRHVASYAKALHNVLRQDPDIIIIQEIRDEETAILALNLAQTNHLVIATLHGITDAPSALLRFVQMVGNNFFSVSTHLQAIIAQQLLPSKDRRSKRVLIQEIMRPRLNPEIRSLLRKQSTDIDTYYQAIGKFNETRQIEERFVSSLYNAIKNNEITVSKAFTATQYEDELLELYRSGKHEMSTIGQVPSYLQRREPKDS